MRRCGFPKPAAGIRRQAHGPGSGRISVQHRKSVSPTPEISAPRRKFAHPAAARPGRMAYNLKNTKKMAVKYYTDDCSYRLPRKRLTAEWLRRVAEAEGYELGDVSYIFCSAQRLLEMNRQYLGHDYFTDVITFDYSDRKGARVISGDIFIDVETVADNARLYGFPTLQEMRRVVVHGVLHLCGQGDKTPRTNAQMHRKEDKYLKFWEEQ